MLNKIRMDLYRMFHTKSLYVVWLILIAGIFFTTSASRLDYEYIQEEAQAGSVETGSDESINFGMNVSLPTKANEKVTVFDQVYANLQAKFIALFMVIFAVLYSSADLNSGYIKQIGGQVTDRGKLIVSKAAALGIFTALTMLLYLIFQVISQRFYYGELAWGNQAELWRYVGTQTALHYALVLIAMALTVILNNHVLSMVIVLCMDMNMMMMLYGMADKLLQRLGAKDFHILNYTVTGKIAMLPMNPDSRECLTALVVAAAFGIAVTALAGQVFRKRDI